jgi:murein L,D-transpeptidase YafK
MVVTLSVPRIFQILVIPMLLLLGVVLIPLCLSEDRENTDRVDQSVAAAARVKPGLEKDLEESGLRFGAPIFLRIFKESDELEVWLQKEPQAVERGAVSPSPQYKLFRIYKICTWSGKLGPKQKRGDFQAPEGFYFVNRRRMNPRSRFHLSFDLGYPNAFDRAHNRDGDYLMVHGNCVSAGCFAMTDNKIEEIYTLADAALNGGQRIFRVHCLPFRMTDERMEKAAQDDYEKTWLSYWENLREGYQWFEENKQPPNVEVEAKKYVFGE